MPQHYNFFGYWHNTNTCICAKKYKEINYLCHHSLLAKASNWKLPEGLSVEWWSGLKTMVEVRMAIIKKSTNKCWRGCGEKGILHDWWECKLVQLLWRTVWKFLKKIKTELPAIPLLSMGTEKTILHRHTCNPIFTAELFTVARTWRQPKYLSTEEWIKRMWYIHTTEYYSVRKKCDAICSNMDEPRYYHIKWSKSEKDKYHISFICGI